MMVRVYVSVGSNMQREINIAAALVALRDLLGNVIESPVYESESVGFKGENFSTWWSSAIPKRVSVT